MTGQPLYQALAQALQAHRNCVSTRVTVRPSLASWLTLHVLGTNHNDIHDYIHETFYCALSQEV